MDADAHGTNQLRVTWSAPSDSGSAAISHYLVRYSRGAIGTIEPYESRWFRTSSRSHVSPELRTGTTYKVEVIAVNRDNRSSRAATGTGTTKRQSQSPQTRPPRGTPTITDIEWHEHWLQKNEDVSITWDTSDVKDATSYKVEYRYVTYPSKSFKLGENKFVLPDIFAEPNPEFSGSKERKGSCDREVTLTTCRYEDVFIEKYVEDNYWNLQFRVVPLANGVVGTASDWIDFSDSVALRVIEDKKKPGACKALDALTLGAAAHKAIRIGSLIAKSGKGVKRLSTSVEAVIGLLNPKTYVLKSAVGTIGVLAGCFDDPTDAFKAMFPIVGHLLDASGALQLLKSWHCLYKNIEDATRVEDGTPAANLALYWAICGSS